MQWIIDGHNLIPNIPGMKLSDLDDEAALIAWLEDFLRKSKDSIEVFFDKAAPGQVKSRKQGRLSITFVQANRTADQAIIERLSRLARNASNYTVVSSDHVVQVNAHAAHAKTMDSSAFVRKVTSLPDAPVKDSDSARPLRDEEIQWWVDFFDRKGRP